MQTNSPYSYETHEWLRHSQVLFARSLSRQSDHGHVEAQTFFRSEYRDPFEADWKCRRFLAAMTFLDRNLASFDVVKGAVSGRSEGIISTDLLLALYRYYSHATDETLSSPPEPKVFLAELGS